MKLLLTLFALCCTFVAVSQNVFKETIYKPKLKRSCIKPTYSVELDEHIPEGSGLVIWNGLLWTHNDSGKPTLFALDTIEGKIVSQYDLPNVKNTDWEELSQDSTYFYLGDFGNNLGKREELQIIRIEKSSLLQNNPSIDFIRFTWPETRTKGKNQKINFNCEAMIIMGDSIFLFTKERKYGRRSRVFSLPSKPGNYTAQYKSTLKTNILITGANYNENQRKLVLCGYNLKLRPFLLIFPDVNGTDFFQKQAKKIRVRKYMRQVEGIASYDGNRYFIINENFRFWFLNTKQQLHILDFNRESD